MCVGLQWKQKVVEQDKELKTGWGFSGYCSKSDGSIGRLTDATDKLKHEYVLAFSE